MSLTRIIGAAVLLTIGATPVLADFYIVREQGAKECRIVREKPTVSTITVVGNKVFKTEEEARSQIKAICTN